MRPTIPDAASTGQAPSRRELLGGSILLGMSLGLSPALAVAQGADARFPIRRSQVRANGEMFHVIEQGSGPAVLFCHGFPEIAETWRGQMQAVAEAGYRAVALDMRGYGQSYAPADPSLYTSLHIVGDLVGVLNALKIETAVIVGHDWGAEHAQRAILLRPDRFRALVSMVIPIAPRGEISYNDEMRKAGLANRFYAFDMIKPSSDARFAPAVRTIPSIFYWLSGSPPTGTGWHPNYPARNMLRPSPVAVPSWADRDYMRLAIRAFEKTGFHGGLNYYRAEQATFDLTPALKGAVIRQPSLYIYGAEDGLSAAFHPTPPTLADSRIQAPGLVDVIRLEKAGHWVQHEAADRINAELIKFLAMIDRR
ncbi:alpha/beta fold hydrolase [uncultured Sphingomonas sp.]|uniref:alpha/beta fold hydrolase n=1 Tax=uncultured Sphingomonas sp. TaxID=158754 RepID=UPI0035CBA017